MKLSGDPISQQLVARRGSVGSAAADVVVGPVRIVLGPFEGEPAASCPFGCIHRAAAAAAAAAVAQDKEEVDLACLYSVNTYWCYCTSEAVLGLLGNIGQRARRLSRVFALEQCGLVPGPGLGLPGLVACSMLQLAAAVVCLVPVID